MEINTKNIVSITEANQNFSKVARMVDENGTAVILRNNKPTYVIIEYAELKEIQKSMDEKVDTVAKRVLEQNMEAFLELAK